MERWWRPSEKAKKDAAEPFPRIEAESRKLNLFLKAELLLLTEHLQRNPSYGKGKGRPLPAQGNPLANLTTIKLSRKKVRNVRPNVCGKYALQSSSRALYNPLDPTHKEWTWPVPFQEVGYAVLIGRWWSADRMVWVGGRVVMIVCCCIRMWWSDLGCDLIVWCDGLMDWFHGLIWISAWGRWCGLTAEKWKDNKVDNSEMAQLSVRELRKEKQRKNMEIIYS